MYVRIWYCVLWVSQQLLVANLVRRRAESSTVCVRNRARRSRVRLRPGDDSDTEEVSRLAETAI